MRQAAEEAGDEQRAVAGREGGQRVADEEGGHQADEQGPAGQPGAQRGDDRRADDDAERVDGDDVAGRGDVDADAVGDVGQHAHRDELGGADREAAEGQGDDGDDHPQGARRRRGGRSVGAGSLTHAAKSAAPRAHSRSVGASARTWGASQPQQVRGGGRPARRARRQPLEAGLPDDDVVPGLGQLGVAEQQLRTAAAQHRLAEQGATPARGRRRRRARASRAAPRRGSAPAPRRPRRGPAAGAPGRGRCRPGRAAGRAGSPTRSAPTSRRSRDSSARTVTAAASPGWHSAASWAVVRPSPATAASASSSEQLGVPQRQLERARRQGQPRPLAAQDLQPRGQPLQRRRPAPVPRCSCSRCCQRSSDSTAATVARTSVSTCGLATWSPPVTSMAPSSSAGQRVVHRRGRAAPRLDGTAEVLAAVDLDGVVDGERGAGGVGADDVLGPAGALDEVHAGRLAAQPRSRPRPTASGRRRR